MGTRAERYIAGLRHRWRCRCRRRGGAVSGGVGVGGRVDGEGLLDVADLTDLDLALELPTQLRRRAPRAANPLADLGGYLR